MTTEGNKSFLRGGKNFNFLEALYDRNLNGLNGIEKGEKSQSNKHSMIPGIKKTTHQTSISVGTLVSMKIKRPGRTLTNRSVVTSQ